MRRDAAKKCSAGVIPHAYCPVVVTSRNLGLFLVDGQAFHRGLSGPTGLLSLIQVECADQGQRGQVPQAQSVERLIAQHHRVSGQRVTAVPGNSAVVEDLVDKIEFSQTFPSGNVDEPEGMVVGPRQGTVGVDGERDGSAEIGAPVIFNPPPTFAGLHVSGAQRAVDAARYGKCAVSADRNATQRRLMAFENTQALAAVDIPQA